MMIGEDTGKAMFFCMLNSGCRHGFFCVRKRGWTSNGMACGYGRIE
jgi:hypothetical protein